MSDILVSSAKARIMAMGTGAAIRWLTIASDSMAQGNDELVALVADMMDMDVSDVTMSVRFAVVQAAGELLTAGETDTISATEGRMTASATDLAANRMQKYRKAAGMTQKELAQMVGVPLQSIQKYENGARSILKGNVEVCLKIARALGTTVEELIG